MTELNVLAASEKNKRALKNAFNLDGPNLHGENAKNLINGKFEAKKKSKFHPFELKILNGVPSGTLSGTLSGKYSDYSGAILYMYIGSHSIYDDINKDYQVMTRQHLDNFPIIENDPGFIPLALLSNFSPDTNYNYPPSGIWDVMVAYQSKNNEEEGTFFNFEEPIIFYVQEAFEDNYIKSGNLFPSSHGLIVKTIGRVEKIYSPNAYPNTSQPDAYWEVLNQYITTNQEIFFTNTTQQFALNCSLNNFSQSHLEYPGAHPDIVDQNVDISNFTFSSNSGIIQYMNHRVEIPSASIDGDGFLNQEHYAYAYAHLDTINLSGYVDFHSDAYKNEPMFKNGEYLHYLGKLTSYMLSGVPFIACDSEWTGPIYVPFAIPVSGENLITTRNFEPIYTQLSAGFIEAVSGAAVPSGITYSMNFVESTECDEEEDTTI